MRKNNNLKIIGLLTIIIVLISGILFIGRELSMVDKKTTSVGVIKTKAAEKTYAKNIAFAPTSTPPNPSPTRLLVQAPSLTPTPTVISTSPTITTTLSPSPTEIIVALNRTGSVSPTNASSPIPTKVSSLPDAGYLTYSIGFFLIAGLAIGLAFLL